MKILFVCSANICRSALCEVVLKQKLIERGITGIDVESAGVHDYSGMPRDTTMVEYALKAGYELGGNAIHLTPLMVDSADLIICMEYFQVVEIQRRFHTPVGVVYTDSMRFVSKKRQICLTLLVTRTICIHTFWSMF